VIEPLEEVLGLPSGVTDAVAKLLLRNDTLHLLGENSHDVFLG
jgi:hypothetical protein